MNSAQRAALKKVSARAANAYLRANGWTLESPHAQWHKADTWVRVFGGAGPDEVHPITLDMIANADQRCVCEVLAEMGRLDSAA